MKSLYFSIFLMTFIINSRAVPVVEESDSREKRSDETDDEVTLKREKRCLFGSCFGLGLGLPGQFSFVVGETILDIQCKRGYLTVCAPDGPNACPVGYSSQTNVGECGFATLNHYLNTTNLAGTCCYKLAGSSSSGVATTTAASSSTASYLIPQIIAYPVYAQYPYAISNSGSAGSTTGTGSSGYGSSSSYGSSPSSSSYGSSPSSSSYGASPSAAVSSYGSPSSGYSGKR